MAGRDRAETWGLLVVAGTGVALVALGILASGAGIATHTFVNYKGQQQIPAFAIPAGITLVAIPVLILTIRGWRRFRIRRFSRRHERRRGA